MLVKIYPIHKSNLLDRDGTINKYVGFLRNAEEFELIDGVSEAIKIINSLGFLCIVITNQPVIARGEVTVDELNSIHNKLETMLGACWWIFKRYLLLSAPSP